MLGAEPIDVGRVLPERRQDPDLAEREVEARRAADRRAAAEARERQQTEPRACAAALAFALSPRGGLMQSAGKALPARATRYPPQLLAFQCPWSRGLAG